MCVSTWKIIAKKMAKLECTIVNIFYMWENVNWVLSGLIFIPKFSYWLDYPEISQSIMGHWNINWQDDFLNHIKRGSEI